jgi:hypothetical protein
VGKGKRKGEERGGKEARRKKGQVREGKREKRKKTVLAKYVASTGLKETLMGRIKGSKSSV